MAVGGGVTDDGVIIGRSAVCRRTGGGYPIIILMESK